MPSDILYGRVARFRADVPRLAAYYDEVICKVPATQYHDNNASYEGWAITSRDGTTSDGVRRIERGGAGTVTLLGAPNSGKSAIVARFTKASTEPTPFPFATQGPIPGMMLYEDVQVQLVDLPPITAEHFPKGMLGLIKSGDAALLVADLEADSVLEDIEAVIQGVEEGRVKLSDASRGAVSATG